MSEWISFLHRSAKNIKLIKLNEAYKHCLRRKAAQLIVKSKLLQLQITHLCLHP